MFTSKVIKYFILISILFLNISKAQVFVPFAYWHKKLTWSPTDLGANLAAWYDASDPTTIRAGVGGASQANDGDLVTKWNDKSGNSFHAVQSTSGREPTYNATAWTGGKPTITWNATNASLVVTGLTLQKYSFGLVMRQASTTSVRAILTKRGAVSANFFWFTFTGNRIFWDQNGNRLDTGFTPAAATDYIYTLIRPLTGSNREQYVNGTLSGSSATNPDDNNSQSLIIGNDYSAANRGVDARISEFIIVSSDMTTVDRQKLEGYLAWRWNAVSNLPAAHPYRTSPPP